jgi:two-component system NtrC family sensor kinase
MTVERDLGLLRLLRSLAAQLEEVRDEERLLRKGLREARDYFSADDACLVVPLADEPRAAVRHALVDRTAWDLRLLSAFLHGERPQIPFDLLLAPLRRRGRLHGAIALRCASGRSFPRGIGWALVTLASEIGMLLDRLDEERIREVRARLDRKVMEQLRPRDLFYQVLDALRSITRYDHSSALFVATPDGAALELVAEQLAAQKGGSRRIGLKLRLEESLRAEIATGSAVALVRAGDRWSASDGSASPLAGLLDTAGFLDPAERTVLCAPIATRRGLIGVLKVSARSPDLLDAFELEVLQQFAPHASVAIQYLQMSEWLRGRMVEAERKGAVASIARGVAHDVNNAFGSVLPIVQQLQVDLETGRLDPVQARDDLRQIEESVQYCRRIFRGMMSFGAVPGGRIALANVRRAIDGTLGMLRTSLVRSGVRVEVDVEGDLPHVRGVQGDLERVIFNLATNAREAMPDGGNLSVQARASGGRVDLRVRDTGHGMSREVLERIYEPGFTTKEEGSGLGLAVCRAIVWSSGGEMSVLSTEGQGAEVRVFLPAAELEGPAA